MTNASTIILVPFLLAFLLFIARFYGRENASSKLNPSFLLALATVVIAGGYLTLGISRMLPDSGTIGFGLVGAALLAFSLFRMFTL